MADVIPSHIEGSRVVLYATLSAVQREGYESGVVYDVPPGADPETLASALLQGSGAVRALPETIGGALAPPNVPHALAIVPGENEPPSGAFVVLELDEDGQVLDEWWAASLADARSWPTTSPQVEWLAP
jgi:hypothetical protein